jgi:hypothetical protein
MPLPSMYSTDNGWKPEGALGGFLGGVGASYGMEEMDDANRNRDIMDAIKQNELDEALLEKPVKERERQFKLESDIPTKTAENATKKTYNESGDALREKQAELVRKTQENEKQKYAQAALERGNWVTEADQVFTMLPGLAQDQAWQDLLKRKPADVNYLQGNLPDATNRQIIAKAAEAAKMSLPVLQHIAQKAPELRSNEAVHKSDRESVERVNAANRASQERIAALNNDGRAEAARLKAGKGDEAIRELREMSEKGTMEDVTVDLVGAAEASIVEKTVKKLPQAAQLSMTMKLMDDINKHGIEKATNDFTAMILPSAPETDRKVIMEAKAALAAKQAKRAGKAPPVAGAPKQGADAAPKPAVRTRYDNQGNPIP